MRLLPLLFALPLAAQTTSVVTTTPVLPVTATAKCVPPPYKVPIFGGTVTPPPYSCPVTGTVTLPAGMTFSITLTPAQAAALLAVFTKGGTDAGITLNLTVPKQ